MRFGQLLPNLGKNGHKRAIYGADVGGQHCQDSVRIHRSVSVGQNRPKTSLNSKSGHSKTLPTEISWFWPTEPGQWIRTESWQCCPPTSDIVHVIGNVFQKEKLDVLGTLDKIASLQDCTSDDRERLLKMGLRLDPNNAKMNFRNEKDTILLYSSKMLRIKKLSQ